MSAFSSRPTVQPGSLQCSQSISPWDSISFSEIGKNHKEQGLVSKEGGEWLLFSLKSKAAAQGVTCGWACCHGAGPRNCCGIWLDVCARNFPSGICSTMTDLEWKLLLQCFEVAGGKCLAQTSSQMAQFLGPDFFLTMMPSKQTPLL